MDNPENYERHFEKCPWNSQKPVKIVLFDTI
jgi:hypothetical protein